MWWGEHELFHLTANLPNHNESLGLFLSPFLVDENQNINNNSDEIITTIPETKPKIQNKIDSIFKDDKSDQEILITKKETPLKNQKKEENFIVDDQEKSFYPTKNKVESVLLSYKNTDLNFTPIQTELILNPLEFNDKKVSKKLDLNDFSTPKINSERKNNEIVLILSFA